LLRNTLPKWGFILIRLQDAASVLPRLQARTSVGPVPPLYALQSSPLPVSYCDRVHQHRRSLTTHSGPHTLGLALRDRLAALALQRTHLLRLIQAAVTIWVFGGASVIVGNETNVNSREDAAWLDDASMNVR